MKDIYIDCGIWLHGEGSAESYLHRAKDGKMCCVGQLAQQCGVEKKRLTGQSLLSKLLRADWSKVVDENWSSNEYRILSDMELSLIHISEPTRPY